jgi:signal transducing adaptor molecule
MHKELASRSFTDAMLRLANDRNTHQAVKAKILERMAEWTEMFSRDPDLGIMEGAYMKLKTQSGSLESTSSYHANKRQTLTSEHPRNHKRLRSQTPTARRKKKSCRWRL